MRERSSVYGSVRLDAGVRRTFVGLLTAIAMLLGLLAWAAPALAAGSASVSAAPRGASHGGTFQPPLHRLSGGAISGHVSFPSETGRISGFSSDGTVDVLDDRGKVVDSTEVDARGDYSVGGLADGTYKVAFARESGYDEAAAQFYDGVNESLGVAAATPVTVNGAEVSDIDATLQFGAQLTGNLVDASGTALSCQVEAYSADGSLVTRLDYSYNRDGQFSIGGLSSGAYYLEVVPSPESNCDQGPAILGAGSELLGSGPGVARSVILGANTSVGTLVYPSGTLSTTPVTPPVAAPVVPAPPAATPVSKPAPSFAQVQKTKVAGSPAIGKVLRVVRAQLSPSPTKVVFHWMRNGSAIKQAHHAKYQVTKADRGKRLSVKVVYVRPGYPNYVVITKVGRVHRLHRTVARHPEGTF